MDSQLKSITIQDALAVIISLGVFALVLMKMAVPDQIWSGWMVVITFFFAQKPNLNVSTSTPTEITTKVSNT